MNPQVLSNLFDSQRYFLNQNTGYRGRFAPSPSGPLHFGSLLAALGSFLQARSQNGQWFVRIEDIDKTREQAGAVNEILDALEAFGLSWDKDHNTSSDLLTGDRSCLVQSHRLERYQSVLQALHKQQQVYACQCSRKQIKAAGGLYQGTCRHLALPFQQQAIRIHLPQIITEFNDDLFGRIQSEAEFAEEDFIVKRRDGLFAYQLVVVIDDIDQGINQVVRGADIMELTCRQLSLYHLFGVPAPAFCHLPLAVKEAGFKLSKQNKAQAINITDPKPELIRALNFLGLPLATETDLTSGSIEQIIQWAVANWRLENVPVQREIQI